MAKGQMNFPQVWPGWVFNTGIITIFNTTQISFKYAFKHINVLSTTVSFLLENADY